MSERDLMIQMLGTLPKAYETTFEMAEKDLTEGTLTIEKLKQIAYEVRKGESGKR